MKSVFVKCGDAYLNNVIKSGLNVIVRVARVTRESSVFVKEELISRVCGGW